MPNISTKFAEAIRRRQVKVCELYEFTTLLGTSYYFTTHDDELIWGNPSKRFIPAPISRGEISSSLNLQSDTVEVSLSGISDALFLAIRNNELDGIRVTIKRALWSEEYGEGCEQIIFSGVGSAEYDNIKVKLSCTSLLSNLNAMVPRNLYQPSCNHVLWDEGCTLDQEDYEEEVTATQDSPDLLTVVSSSFLVPTGDYTYWDLGECRVTTGDNINLSRTIKATQDHLIVLMSPLRTKILDGDKVIITPGCDKLKITCVGRYKNHHNFYGFLYMPAPESVLSY